MVIERISRWFEAWVHPMAKFMNWVGSFVLLIMMFLTVADVFLRKVYSKSILGTVEVTEFMLLIVIFFTMASTEFNDGHVKVDLVVRQLSHRSQGIVDMITQFICFGLCGMITWSTFLYALSMKISGEVSQDLWIPMYPFVFLVALGCAVFTFALLIKFFNAVLRVMQK